ncbi:MAG: 3'-5' exonuclease [Gammaproteobacteria bacterium]|nr:MAG: 3'-5' exonuclease [Gammaproteobacteria bacterium]TDJ46797.1 MAG: 3'-5' exonuclease [Gammaproteobacteria bacterium]
MNTLVFDIETVPDVELGRRLHGVDDLDDDSVAKIMFFKQRQARQTDFLPLPQHRIVAISAVLRSRDELHVFTLGDIDATEKDIVGRFYDGIERYSPELVSWNGTGFDLPVLNYRALLHGVNAEHYWEMGDSDREFRYNNYLSRFHWRHLDLMDVLSGFQIGARSSLQQVATLLGFPGKLGMSGDQVWDRYQVGELSAIRDYCETDALNTYLIYLRFQLVRGILDETRYNAELEQLRAKLEQAESPHFDKFLAAWRSGRDAE